MDIEKSLRMLGLPERASLEQVKRAFRARAFELHPDLHPHDPQAARKFQQLNEAYVTLTHHLRARSEKPESETFGSTSRKARKDGPDRARRAYHSRTDREEVLRDILSDPFARQVFEDIYRTIRKRGSRATVLEQSASGKKQALAKAVTSSTGAWGSLKERLRSQLDDEQSITLAPELLRPGQTIRFQITRRFSGPPVSLQVTLPPDYVVGRPIRLKGYGRRIGPFKGDLYLRFLPE
ncbi:MAG: J domain-containing protein [Desulfohalobiaceae bacterium]